MRTNDLEPVPLELVTAGAFGPQELTLADEHLDAIAELLDGRLLAGPGEIDNLCAHIH